MQSKKVRTWLKPTNKERIKYKSESNNQGPPKIEVPERNIALDKLLYNWIMIQKLPLYMLYKCLSSKLFRLVFDELLFLLLFDPYYC